MKAPDKIYLEKSLSFPDRFHSQWYKEDVVGNGVEYIRKDLILEWAKNEFENAKITDFDEFGRGEVITWERIIEKLNSL